MFQRTSFSSNKRYELSSTSKHKHTLVHIIVLLIMWPTETMLNFMMKFYKFYLLFEQENNPLFPSLSLTYNAQLFAPSL